MRICWILSFFLAVGACTDDGSPPPDGGLPACPDPPPAPEVGSPSGHPDPLGATATEARAGRIRAADLPPLASGMLTWADGDFVLANDRVALVIEDVGDSDLYDPWGGRPVGMARVEGGRLVEPADFGELFLLTSRATVMTTSVSVIADGSDGGPAIVRAAGQMQPLPFFDNITANFFRDAFAGMPAAIDYVLAPGAEQVDVVYRYESARPRLSSSGVVMHGFMYTKRMPSFAPGLGFTDHMDASPYFALVDDDATSWAYASADMPLGTGISASGFISGFTDPFPIAACAETVHPHARIVIGGPGLDGLVQAVARSDGAALRAITGTVRRGGAPAAGVRVHATDDTGAYLTRTTSAGDGSFALHVPAAAGVRLTAYRTGDAVVSADVGLGDAAELELPAQGAIRVVATDPAGARLPVRVQILPAGGQAVPEVPGTFGEPDATPGRLHVAFPMSGEVTLPVPPGRWEVVVSRGYEYEIERRTVDVAAGATALVEASLERVVDTTGVQCGDFHIHTLRSNDSADDGLRKVAGAVADGLELPVRSDHEYVADFRAEIAALGVEAWAYPIASIELTSMEIWGHMGVFPLVPDPSRPNSGAPRWQRFPTAAAPEVALATLSPKQVFDDVRARPEAPVVIINHPRGGANYFDYVGFDPVTGMVERTADWDPAFTLVEVFNDSGWLASRNRTVADWLALVRSGRRVFAVGSSDSHGIARSPVGYPRTCVELGSDDPRALTADRVRDRLAAGRATVSGGIFVDARVGTAGPGGTARGVGASATATVTVQAARWVDVDAIDVVVDGETIDTIPVMPDDADPANPVVRWRGEIPVPVAGTGSFVVIAAYGDAPLEPVHPGRLPFGVTNPIFLAP